jgi:hypothetical protein
MSYFDYNGHIGEAGHYESWNNNLGNNFTDNTGIHQEMMKQKNIETGGGYQATVSGMYGEFTIAAVFKSLPDEYAVLNDILIQTGTQLRKYSLKDYQKYGETPWDLAVKVNKKQIKRVDKEKALRTIMSNPNDSFYEVIKKSSQIDHVIVSPYGIFVIETKNHKGWVFGDVQSKVWTQVINGETGNRAYGGHSHYTFYNPLQQNEQHMVYLSKYLRCPRQYMLGMIVFTNPEAYLGNVNCNCCYTLDTFAQTLLSYTNRIWSEKQTEKVIHAIEKLDSNSYSLSKEHVKFVQDIQKRHEINKMYKMNQGLY